MKNKQVKNRMHKYLNRGFSKAQLKEIRKGIESGLSTEQVDCYAKKSIKTSCMKEMRKGLERGLKEQYVKALQYQPEFSNSCDEVLYDMTGLDGLDEGDDLALDELDGLDD